VLLKWKKAAICPEFTIIASMISNPITNNIERGFSTLFTEFAFPVVPFKEATRLAIVIRKASPIRLKM
jgi:hypothetical protein